MSSTETDVTIAVVLRVEDLNTRSALAPLAKRLFGERHHERRGAAAAAREKGRGRGLSCWRPRAPRRSIWRAST